jgi:hypothetical protein
MKSLIVIFAVIAIAVTVQVSSSRPEIYPAAVLQPGEGSTNNIVSALVGAYDPYDDCVGKWQYIWPRKTAGNGEVEKMGVAADPANLPYGTRVRFLDQHICRFIHETDPTNDTCILTVDDTGQAAIDDTQRGMLHLELRVPRRTPNENAHQRAKSFGRFDNTKVEIIPLEL